MSTKSSSRLARDRLYMGFLVMHAVATVVIDIQPVLPPTIIPSAFKKLLNFYIIISNDPLMIGASSGSPNYLWFRWLLAHEFIFFLPTYLFGILGLWKGDPTVYPLLLAYGAAASTTTATCLIDVLFGSHDSHLTTKQSLFLLSSYVPFFILPLTILLDMYFRISTLLRASSHKVKDL
ncbi:transmembrane protein 6/97 [Melampsora americana]|nr:transmembrane protein 6/97 [Melampsora americana]